MAVIVARFTSPKPGTTDRTSTVIIKKKRMKLLINRTSTHNGSREPGFLSTWMAFRKRWCGRWAWWSETTRPTSHTTYTTPARQRRRRGDLSSDEHHQVYDNIRFEKATSVPFKLTSIPTCPVVNELSRAMPSCLPLATKLNFPLPAIILNVLRLFRPC